MNIEHHPTPASEWASSRTGNGIEHPATLEHLPVARSVQRCFAFIDLCGSTAYLEQAGPTATLDVVNSFRNSVRDIAAARGVRVAKWMGDGVMLVGTSNGPVIATVVETCGRPPHTLPSRAGIAASAALLFDGDDYLGCGANLAARFCELAEPGRILCSAALTDDTPNWVTIRDTTTVTIRGIGPIDVIDVDPWNDTRQHHQAASPARTHQ